VKGTIPINPDNEDIFTALEDGIILSKLINIGQPNTIDFRAINNKKNLNIYQIKENLNLALNSAKGIGLKIPGINGAAFVERKSHLILAVVWQVVRLILTKSIDLKECPQIMRLAEEGEELKDLTKLQPEQILIRWMNFHLKQAGQERRVTNLGGDIKDSISLIYVLNQLDKTLCPLDGLSEEDVTKRAEIMIQNSIKLGVPSIVRPSDVTSGNTKINTIFVAEIFNHRHGLEELNEEEKEAFEKFGIQDDDIEGSKDERAFRLWINSLNLEDVYIGDLTAEVMDGLALLKVLHKLDPNCIDWKVVDKKPNNTYKMGINC
jgi:plastin-1